jgi:hypothetical protein
VNLIKVHYRPGAGEVVQVVEQLPSKSEALSSSLHTTKKKPSHYMPMWKYHNETHFSFLQLVHTNKK